MRFQGRLTWLLPVVAAALFGTLLAWRRLGPLDFWWGMSVSVATLVILSWASDRSQRSSLLQDWTEGVAKKIGLGLLSGFVLYGVFWAGNAVSRAVLPWAAEDIGAVYAFRQNASLIRIGLLIVLIIGPGEELFWRGFLQRRWQSRLGLLPGYLLAAGVYAVVHAGSGNLMLVASAFVCGLYWGALYVRFRSAILVAVSHTLWDLLIFIIFPLS